MTYLNKLIKKYFNSNNDIIDEKSLIKKKIKNNKSIYNILKYSMFFNFKIKEIINIYNSFYSNIFLFF